MTKPSDRAIAQAFWELLAAGTGKRTVFGCMLHIENRAREIDAEAKPRIGACENKRRPGGCQLHNLHCGYPKCDEFPADAAAPEGAQVAVIDAIAIALWHRFAPESHIEWEDETHKAEYRDAAVAVAALATPPQPQDAARDREDAELFRYIEKHVAAWHSNEAAMPRFVFDPRFRNRDGELCSLAVTGHDGVGQVSLRTALRIIQADDAERGAASVTSLAGWRRHLWQKVYQARISGGATEEQARSFADAAVAQAEADEGEVGHG